MNDRTAYYNGAWIPESELAIPVADLGFAMGVTVTERLRTFCGQVFRKADHLARMRSSLEVIGLAASTVVAELEVTIDEYERRHREQVKPGDDWAVIAFVTPGVGAGPTICVHGHPLPFGDWANEYNSGVSMLQSQHRQVPPSCWPASLKCRSRMHYYLAEIEARTYNPTSRAVLLDQEGYIGEGSTANLVTFDGKNGLSTPKSTKVLPGVSLGVIAELAPALGLELVERDITVEEFAAAEEVWLASTSICMLPVVEFNDQPIGSGTPGSMYARFLDTWRKLVGVDIAEQAERFAIRF